MFNVCLGAGSREYCRYTKSPLGIAPLKEICESPLVKENLTRWGMISYFPGATRFPYYISII